MMFREANELSRKYLANPHQGKSFIERLKSNKSIDLRDNMVIIDLGNGYSDIKPRDENKRFK
ncbi:MULTISPECIES: hypothetical protein [Bacillus amyloliquefaciens group]|nr:MULTISPECIES: hypothetical protein [Bacillus amyloliquefaciens group]